MASIEDARYLGALPAGIGDVFQVWRILELVSDVGIGKAADHVLAIEQSAELGPGCLMVYEPRLRSNPEKDRD